MYSQWLTPGRENDRVKFGKACSEAIEAGDKGS